MEMGKVAIEEDPLPTMGEAPVVEEIELMGDVMAPEPDVVPEPMPVMGQAPIPSSEVPCDGPTDPSLVSPSKPRRF